VFVTNDLVCDVLQAVCRHSVHSGRWVLDSITLTYKHMPVERESSQQMIMHTYKLNKWHWFTSKTTYIYKGG